MKTASEGRVADHACPDFGVVAQLSLWLCGRKALTAGPLSRREQSMHRASYDSQAISCHAPPGFLMTNPTTYEAFSSARLRNHIAYTIFA
jgi:hypothetical protein